VHALIVHAHPEPTSFNAVLTAAAADALDAHGDTVEISDLYRDGFDPVEGEQHYAERLEESRFVALAEQRHAGKNGTLAHDVQREIARLKRADFVILQFPLWWHAQPAILKGWFDRVFVSGLLYTSAMRYDRGVFRGKRALLSVTSGAPETSFEPGGRSGDIEKLLWPIHYSLHYMGFSVLTPQLSFGVSGHGFRYESDGARDARLCSAIEAWRGRVAGLDAETPIRFPGWGDWDEEGRARDRRSIDAGLRFRTGTDNTAQMSNW
jgi:NAD(P)H dehydrogenase (quinone)